MPKPLFPIIPNSLNIIERLEYNTDILEAFDGSEQRIGFREKPFRFLTFDFTILRHDKVLLEAGLFSNINDDHNEFTVPIWQDLQILGVEAAAGQKQVQVNPADRDYQFAEIDNLAVLISGSLSYDRARGIADYEFEIGTVDSTGAPTLFTMVDNLVDTWAVGTLVCPARQGWLIDIVTFSDPSHQSDLYINGRATFKFRVV